MAMKICRSTIAATPSPLWMPINNRIVPASSLHFGSGKYTASSRGGSPGTGASRAPLELAPQALAPPELAPQALAPLELLQSWLPKHWHL
ncbi:hypothetical protein F0562_028881 [Nyssa sinensis]|uniref:Uncharacterized protein n=1 Tax=Nyssa sinensis TaxID=561372 RepID=A0A5J5AZD7_9ASTE|nr:hypothetical protein F0562_028881 [Nyssa sinensis]